jgi:signal peptidase I
MRDALQSSPWLSVWLNPRSTIERVLTTQPRRHVLLLAALAGIANIIGLLAIGRLAIALLDWRIFAAAVVIGAATGVAGLYIAAFFFKWIAKMFGGRASMVEMRAVIAWGALPLAIIIPIFLIALLALKFSRIAGESALITVLEAFAGVLALWTLIWTILIYARAQGFGFWRATVSAVIAWFLAWSVLSLPMRAFLFQPFNIPSGSMMPTLLLGDYVFVSKYLYGYSRYSLPFSPRLFSGRLFASEPQRGDVVVFRLPKDDSSDYIKRVVGLPGDRIQMIRGVLNINGIPIKRERVEDFAYEENGRKVTAKRWRETLPNGVTYTTLDMVDEGYYDNTQVYTVPPGHYFMMGDNLDNSTDSRVLTQVGYVPFENLVGRAAIIYFSIDRESHAAQPMIRFERFGMVVR